MRVATTFALGRKHDFKPGGFQHGDGGDADLRLVITRKRVVPKNDFPPVARAELGALGEPMIKTLGANGGNGRSVVNPNSFPKKRRTERDSKK